MSDPSIPMERKQLARWLAAEWASMTGRQYRIDLEALDIATLRELQRLTRDIEGEHRLTLNRARILPWRRS